MYRNSVMDIRSEFRRKKREHDFRGNGTIEIQACSFKADQPTIFGERNEKYVAAEIDWYESCDRRVEKLYEIYGKTVQIWDSVKDEHGCVNSQYGYRIYEQTQQYQSVLDELARYRKTRQAVMYYVPLEIHEIAGKDHICTTSVQYFLNNRIDRPPMLNAVVNMRSNDAIFGYANDFAWQHHVLVKLSADLCFRKDFDCVPGGIYWNAGSFHIYERHYDLIK